MKYLLTFFSIVFIIGIAKAQESVSEQAVPQEVKKIFSDKYPEATTNTWFKNNDSIIEAKFSLNRKKTIATFLTNGKFLSSNTEIAPKEMPGMVSNYIRSEHPNEIVSLAKLLEDANGTTSYYVEIKQSGVNQAITKLYFDFFGKLIKSVKPQEIKIEKDSEAEVLDDLGGDLVSGEFIKKKELPSKVNTYIDKTYIDYRFENAIFIESESGTLYQVKLRRIGYKEFIFAHFDLLGNYVKIDK